MRHQDLVERAAWSGRVVLLRPMKCSRFLGFAHRSTSPPELDAIID